MCHLTVSLFAIDDVLERSIEILVDGDVLSSHRLTDLGCADDIALLASNVQAAQFFLNRLTTEATRLDMQFAPSISVMSYFRTGGSLYLHRTWALKDWKLLKVSFDWKAVGLEMVV